MEGRVKVRVMGRISEDSIIMGIMILFKKKSEFVGNLLKSDRLRC